MTKPKKMKRCSMHDKVTTTFIPKEVRGDLAKQIMKLTVADYPDETALLDCFADLRSYKNNDLPRRVTDNPEGTRTALTFDLSMEYVETTIDTVGDRLVEIEDALNDLSRLKARLEGISSRLTKIHDWHRTTFRAALK